MWFVAALLAFSLGYAVLRRLRGPPRAERPFRFRALVGAAVMVAVGSMLAWVVWPPDSSDTFLNLRFGLWPQGAVLCAVGVHWVEAGWAVSLPRLVVRRLGRTALGGIVLLVSSAGVASKFDALQTTRTGGDWLTVLLAALTGVIGVSWTVWAVAWLRLRFNRQGGLLRKAGRASYATYLIHPLVLTSVMVLLADLPLAAAVKVVLVFVVVVRACFAAGYVLTRLPGVSAVL